MNSGYRRTARVMAKNPTPRQFLKRFSDIGRMVSPLFLKRHTAIAQNRPQSIARVSPMCDVKRFVIATIFDVSDSRS